MQNFLRFYLKSHKIEESDLVNSWRSSDNYYITSFEEDPVTIILHHNLISNVHINDPACKITITFKNSDKLELPYLGISSSLFTFSTIIQNSNLNSPLVALLKSHTQVPGRLGFIIKGKDKRSPDLERNSSTVSYRHETPIVGLYECHKNQVVLNFYSKGGKLRERKVIFIETNCEKHEPNDRKPYVLVQPRVRDDQFEGEKFVFVNQEILDMEGNVRWKMSLPSRQERYKVYTLSRGRLGVVLEESKSVEIYDYVGQILMRFKISEFEHQGLQEKNPGGNILIWYRRSAQVKTDDIVEEYDIFTGEKIQSVDLGKIFDFENIQQTVLANSHDVKSLNFDDLSYNYIDNSLLLSSNQSQIIASVDYETLRIKWMIGNIQNCPEKLQRFLIKPLQPNSFFDQNIFSDKIRAFSSANGNLIVISEHEKSNLLSEENSRDGGSKEKNTSINLGEEKKELNKQKLIELKIDEKGKTFDKILEYNLSEDEFETFKDLQVLNDDIYMIIGEHAISILNLESKKLLFKVLHSDRIKQARIVDFDVFE